VDLQPHINEYVHLFRGFSKFGVIPDRPLRQVDRLFPIFEKAEPGNVHDVRAIERIWSRGVLRHTPSVVQSNPWTRETFQEMMESFLKLRPFKGIHGDRAPTAGDIWLIMFAMSRVCGGDARTVCGIWEVLRRKFEGGDDGHGWTKWKLDNRLRRLVRGLEHILVGVKRDSI
jgi:hypothetical protein